MKDTNDKGGQDQGNNQILGEDLDAEKDEVQELINKTAPVLWHVFTADNSKKYRQTTVHDVVSQRGESLSYFGFGSFGFRSCSDSCGRVVEFVHL
jgi:hypothetical protein